MPDCKWKILALNGFSTERSVFLRRGKSDNSLAWLIRIWCKIFRGRETRRLEKFIFARTFHNNPLSVRLLYIEMNSPLRNLSPLLEHLHPPRVIRAWLPLSIRIQVESGPKTLDSSRWMSAIIAGEKFSTRGVIAVVSFSRGNNNGSDLVD